MSPSLKISVRLRGIYTYNFLTEAPRIITIFILLFITGYAS